MIQTQTYTHTDARIQRKGEKIGKCDDENGHGRMYRKRVGLSRIKRKNWQKMPLESVPGDLVTSDYITIRIEMNVLIHQEKAQNIHRLKQIQFEMLRLKMRTKIADHFVFVLYENNGCDGYDEREGENLSAESHRSAFALLVALIGFSALGKT